MLTVSVNLFRLREFYTARETLRKYMAKQIEQRKAEIHAEFADGSKSLGRQDVFSLLVKASEGDGKLRLDDSELVRVQSPHFHDAKSLTCKF